jgi:hypothetical protein
MGWNRQQSNKSKTRIVKREKNWFEQQAKLDKQVKDKQTQQRKAA